jgi:hypothetical protein
VLPCPPHSPQLKLSHAKTGKSTSVRIDNWKQVRRRALLCALCGFTVSIGELNVNAYAC